METSLKAIFAQIFSCSPKILSCPKFGGGGGGGGVAPPPPPPPPPLAPPGPYAHEEQECCWPTINRAGAAVVSIITSFSNTNQLFWFTMNVIIN